MCPTSMSWVLVIQSRYRMASTGEGEPILMEHILGMKVNGPQTFHTDSLLYLWLELQRVSVSKWTNSVRNTAMSSTTSFKTYRYKRWQSSWYPYFRCASEASGLLLSNDFEFPRPTAPSGAYFFCCNYIEGKKSMHSEDTKMVNVQGYS